MGGHVLQTSAFLTRWSVLRFRRHPEPFHFRTLKILAPSIAHPHKPSTPILLGSTTTHRVFKNLTLIREYPQEARCRAFSSRIVEDFEGDEEEEQEDVVYGAGDDYVVVNFYHFVEIEDAHGEVARHLAFVEGRNIRGRIYINHQGINAQLSGPKEDAMAYAEWVKADERFAPTYIQVSPSPRGHAFPRLRLRYKPSLVQVCESDDLPLTDASARAVPLTPKEWREKLETRQKQSDSELLNVKKVLLLDVRNRYEWDVGHFQGAQRPEVECFKSTEFGLSDDKEVEEDPLAGVDKENTDIMMYCTGGIRCDVYSTILRKKGFKNLYSLRGGVAKYLKEEGASQWNGRLFVFDSRLAVPPAFYHGDSEDSNDADASITARCVSCGSTVEPVHRNCANLDCNNLYLSCAACVTKFRGCCCNNCMEAPRLRPILKPDETYQRWHNYRDPPPPPPRPPGWVSRRALKRRRRKERRKEAAAATAALHQDSSTDTDTAFDSSPCEEASSLIPQL